MSLTPTFELGIWNAWIFMAWLVVQNIGIRLISKEAYQRAGDPPDTKPGRAYKLVSMLSMPLWILSTLYSIFLPLKLDTTWFAVGLATFLSGAALSIVATASFARAPLSEPVTTGAYRLSRHPIYLAMLLIYLSVGIASASWIFLLVTLVWAVMFGISAKDEEAYCLDRYGQAYREYLSRTPRWLGIPGVQKP